MTVGELFESDKITKEFVDKISGESLYMESVERFLLENWHREIENLSDNQAAWMHKIYDDLVERRINEQRTRH